MLVKTTVSCSERVWNWYNLSLVSWKCSHLKCICTGVLTSKIWSGEEDIIPFRLLNWFTEYHVWPSKHLSAIQGNFNLRGIYRMCHVDSSEILLEFLKYYNFEFSSVIYVWDMCSGLDMASSSQLQWPQQGTTEPLSRAWLSPTGTVVILRQFFCSVSERLTPRLADLRCLLSRMQKRVTWNHIFYSMFWITGEMAEFLFWDEFGDRDSKIYVSVMSISNSVLGRWWRLDLIKNW